MIVLTLEQIVRYLEYFDICVTLDLLTSYEKSMLFGVGNILWFIILGFVFYVLYKIFSRLINAIF